MNGVEAITSRFNDYPANCNRADRKCPSSMGHYPFQCKICAPVPSGIEAFGCSQPVNPPLTCRADSLLAAIETGADSPEADWANEVSGEINPRGA